MIDVANVGLGGGLFFWGLARKHPRFSGVCRLFVNRQENNSPPTSLGQTGMAPTHRSRTSNTSLDSAAGDVFPAPYGGVNSITWRRHAPPGSASAGSPI
jgi:hypothetical protein